MQIDNARQRARLLDALGEAWDAEGELVRRFGLTWLESQVESYYGGWSVPVASATAGGNARELIGALNRIEERIEKSTALDVSVFLEPSLNGTTEN